jgi:methionyl-tRNA formyltransferase
MSPIHPLSVAATLFVSYWCACTSFKRTEWPMRILCLSPYPERLAAAFAADAVDATADPITPGDLASVDWVVSYGYRHILRQPILDALPGRFVNLHIACLPWNRGAHPNYWSWAEGTPKGVTIHQIDAGIDTGPIIAQRLLCLSPEQTFRQTYAKLQDEMEALFADAWPVIRAGRCEAFPQVGAGTHHYARELPDIPGGWDCSIARYVEGSPHGRSRLLQPVQ